MSGTRAYVPSTLTALRDLVAAGGIGPAPVRAHAVTDALRAEYSDGGEEDWEYAAMSAAARDALALLTDDDPPRRVVVAVDAGSVDPVKVAGDPEDLTLVELREVVPARAIAAVHVDTADAEEAVAASRSAWADAENGDPAAVALVERCLDHELAWFATQEIGALIRG